jgi:hypothetical protein
MVYDEPAGNYNSTKCYTTKRRNLPNNTTPPNVQLHPLLHNKQAGNYPVGCILKIMCGQIHGVCFTGCGSIFF